MPKFRKTKISYHLIHTCTYQGGKKCWFFGKFDVLCFLVTSVLRFALLPYYQRIMVVNLMKNSKTGHIQILQYYLSFETQFFMCQKSATQMFTFSRYKNQGNEKKYNNQNMKLQFKTTEAKPLQVSAFENRNDIA